MRFLLGQRELTSRKRSQFALLTRRAIAFLQKVNSQNKTKTTVTTKEKLREDIVPKPARTNNEQVRMMRCVI
jgi:hypothetical protein